MSQTRYDPNDPVAVSRAAMPGDLLIVLMILFVMWTVYTIEHHFFLEFAHWGMRPRDPKGLIGIVTMPFLHKDYEHLWSNSVAMLIMGFGTIHFYRKVAARVFLIGGFLCHALVWCFARDSYHIGASGVVYVLSSFLFVSGVIRRDRQSTGVALIVAMLYGASIWGVFPIERGVSWEGHLFGALAGLALAVRYRKVDLPEPDPEYDDVDDDSEDDPGELPGYLQPAWYRADPEEDYGPPDDDDAFDDDDTYYPPSHPNYRGYRD